MDLQGIFNHLLAGQTLTSEDAESVIADLLEGKLNEAQMGAMLALLQHRRATVDELIGGARAMRRHVTPLPASHTGGPIIDTCGTGGAPKTFNISTAAAIVTAAAAGPARVRVAKHGNRSRSGRGSAEVLAGLGVNVDAPPDVQARCLDQVGVCFCFAIHYHPAMKHSAPVRRSLGFPTIFNLLGPLTNPAGAARQLIGVYGADEAQRVASALAGLGAQRAMVVHGFDGMDEISTRDRTHIFHVHHNPHDPHNPALVRGQTFTHEELNIPIAPPGSLEARDLDHGIAIVRGILEGRKNGDQLAHARDIVLLNAAAALTIADAADSMHTGFTLAAQAIDSGAASRTLTQLIECSRS